MKLLLIGFQPLSEINYPHLEQTVRYLRSQGADYCLFRERGYFLGEKTKPGDFPRASARTLLNYANIFVDTFRLLIKRIKHRYDVTIAVDNFSYFVASRIFPNVILWSHDFLTDDEPRSKSAIQRFIFRQVRKCLLQQRRIIIQDRERLRLFMETYLGGPDQETLDAFLLPVSVMGESKTVSDKPSEPPVLMQIGGINKWRSHSDLLLQNYQTEHRVYALAFHGFIDQEMAELIANAKVPPSVSDVVVASGDIHKIVEKCDIGFIAYGATNKNFYYIARASGQIAEFTRCCKPLVILGDNNMRQTLETEKFGISISTIDELPAAVRTIHENYGVYSGNSRQAFNHTYDLSRHLSGLKNWIFAESRN
ncbi:MAG: hypothetical protein ACREO1_01735 [Arenimonas sp.]